MENKDGSYYCEKCKKFYSSYKSLWNHTKNYHINNVNKSKPLTKQIVNNECIKKFNCKICNKELSCKQSKWRHEKNCKQSENFLLLEENKKLKEEINVIKKQSKNIINNINNGTINKNIIINQFGNEQVSLLSQDEIKKLASSNFNALVDIVKLLNFNENYPENHNFCTTSLEGDYVNVLNPENNQIEKINKIDFYNSVMDKSIDKVNQLLVLLEFDENYDNLKPKFYNLLENIVKDPTIFAKKNNKTIYNKNINEISYNNKELVLNTWNKLMNEPLDDEESIFTDLTTIKK
jgi:hypothetical protein